MKHSGLDGLQQSMVWTEDCCGPRPCGANRLHTVADDDNYSYYAYDASGERRLKMTGSSTIGDINADRVFVTATLKEVTLYPSPYVVVSNKGYTKHYYAGAERVAAGMGGGGLGELANFLEPNDGQQTIADGLLQQCLTQVNGRHTDANTMSIVGMCHVSEMDIYINGIPDGMSAEVGADMDEFAGMANAMVDAGTDTGVYFYHSDHLGSASWITDSGGAAVQHLQYLPFGEPYVNQRTSGYSERFTFTGKERDEETGYSYFSARYLDNELLASFISVDRYTYKYPFISPYAYCVWNPIKLIDPTGDTLVAKESHSERDIKRVAEKYGDRIHFDENGIAAIDYSGMTEDEIKKMKKHDGVALLLAIIESDKKILYEATDIILVTNQNGEKIAGTMAGDNNGVVNLSRGGYDSNMEYSYMPQNGYDGQVIISVSGKWKNPRGFYVRTEIVSHELAENYARTVLGKDYRGVDSAHRYANTRMKNLHEEYEYEPHYDNRKTSVTDQKKMREYLGY